MMCKPILTVVTVCSILVLAMVLIQPLGNATPIDIETCDCTKKTLIGVLQHEIDNECIEEPKTAKGRK